MSVRATALRLFLTCWVVYGAFFATDVVREHYLAAAIGDDASFRVDAYGGLHPDLFETPGRGWHIGNNPGASMIGAIPYAPLAPAIEAVTEHVRERRRAVGATEPPAYETDWPLSKRFYEEAWRRGLDVKLGLVAWVTHALAMAPLSAGAVVLVFLVLVAAFDDRREARTLALVYAFATPVFFRTGFLNQNMLLGHAALAGFAVVWNPAGWALSPRARSALAGFAAGVCVLLDYSGVVVMAGLYAYLLVTRRHEGGGALLRATAGFAAGAAAPVALLWFYQWRAFGDPFLPGQHWMPPVEWSDLGYQGYGPPRLDLLAMLLADPRFGLFVAGPFFLLAIAWPWVGRGRAGLPSREGWTCLALLAGVALFFSGSHYTRLQFNTGVRYMAAAFPFAFLPAAAVWTRLPRAPARGAVAVAAIVSLPLAMYREVERPLGVADPIVRTLLHGPELPVHRTVSRMASFTGPIETLVSPWIVLPLVAGLVVAIWTVGAGRRGAERAPR